MAAQWLDFTLFCSILRMRMTCSGREAASDEVDGDNQGRVEGFVGFLNIF